MDRPPDGDGKLAAWPKQNPAIRKIAPHTIPNRFPVFAESILVMRAMLSPPDGVGSFSERRNLEDRIPLRRWERERYSACDHSCPRPQPCQYSKHCICRSWTGRGRKGFRLPTSLTMAAPPFAVFEGWARPSMALPQTGVRSSQQEISTSSHASLLSSPPDQHPIIPMYSWQIKSS